MNIKKIRKAFHLYVFAVGILMIASFLFIPFVVEDIFFWEKVIMIAPMFFGFSVIAGVGILSLWDE